MKLGDLRTSQEVLEDDLRDPAFRAEWERTAVARTFALQLLEYRTARGLSQDAVGQLLGMKQPQVARIEAAAHTPNLETLTRFAKLAGRELDVKILPGHEPTLQFKLPRIKKASPTARPRCV